MLNVLTGNKSSTEKKNDTKSVLEMILDSAIIALITVFSLWTGQELSFTEALTLIKAFGISFFVQLAWYRGLKKAEWK